MRDILWLLASTLEPTYAPPSGHENGEIYRASCRVFELLESATGFEDTSTEKSSTASETTEDNVFSLAGRIQRDLASQLGTRGAQGPKEVPSTSGSLLKAIAVLPRDIVLKAAPKRQAGTLQGQSA
ncbi:hypothetical protein LTR02_017641, partial [Friedmanniomyces endolithicus]